MTFYRRNLPHLEKEGGVYFVTFSTKDEFILPEPARSLVFDHCLFENGKTIPNARLCGHARSRASAVHTSGE